MHVKDYVPLEKLKKLVRSEKNPRVARRIQIIILALEGYTAPGIALSLSLSRRACQEWVKRFNQQGLPGLQDQPGRGRNALLTPEENEAFKKRLDAGPTAADGVCTFQGEDLRRVLENEFGKVRSLGADAYHTGSPASRQSRAESDREPMALFEKSLLVESCFRGL